MRLALAGLIVAAVAAAGSLTQDVANILGGQADRVSPTALPDRLADYWLVPDGAVSGAPEAAAGRLARGVRAIAASQPSQGLPLVDGQGLSNTPLEAYARYYEGVALHDLARLEDADRVLSALVEAKPSGVVRELATVRLAEIALARGDGERAEDLLEELTEEALSAPENAWLALARAEEAIGHIDHALDAYRRLYYGYPLSTQAADAQEALARLDEASARVQPDRFVRELGRAEALFEARQWDQALTAFEDLAPAARGDNRALIAIRIAECQYQLNRHRAARDGLRPYLAGGDREAEARFFHLSATRALGDHPAYVTLARGLVADHPESEWAVETLNNLASHYIIVDQDARADEVFRELLRRFPEHRHAERAAWKVGWWAYRHDRYEEAAALFEHAAGAFPRADYRPSWLYWSGRARDALNQREAANARYRLTVTDYQNSYYGRLASAILAERTQPPVTPGDRARIERVADEVPTAELIRALIAAGLLEDALREVQHAQRLHGDSPRLQATSAWIRHRQGLTLSATERFLALRGAITTMRRAYPQFMAAGGEQLPPEVLRIIFPLDFWPLLTKYADAHGLDRYLLAALVAQESTFTPEIRSSANAYGLMQVIPDTGRLVARQLGIRGFTTAMLTQPEVNVRLGTKYFKDMVERFGGEHYALAGYNAGPHRVAAWLKEAPGLPRDEFIDNIPFTETQAYVKRILGTAEDYRILYGTGVLDPNARLVVAD